MTELHDPAPQRRKPRKLAVDLSDLVNAIENNTGEMACFFDREAGEVICRWQADPTNGSAMICQAHNMIESDQFAQGIGLRVYSAIIQLHALASALLH